MSEMATSLGSMVKVTESRMELKTHEEPKTPKLPENLQERAIAILERDAALPDNEFLEVIDHFIADPNFARVYYATLQTRLTNACGIPPGSSVGSSLKMLRGEGESCRSPHSIE
jgi:hypothetical protein